jgi:HTH-type transcriptional regulator, competence development regulator
VAALRLTVSATPNTLRPMDSAQMTFGRRLRELRPAKGLSQRDLAERIGVDFTYLSKIENDRTSPPSAKMIAAVAEELGGDVDELAVLANKTPSDVVALLTQYPEAIKAFRSLAGDLHTKSDWQRYLRDRNQSPGRTPRSQ